MHIEINNGGLFGGASIEDFQINLDHFIDTSNGILSAFKTVENQTHDLNGGVGSLAEAVELIGLRIREEQRKIEAALEVKRKTVDFVVLANRVDKQVAELVDHNREAFYRINPWLRPPHEGNIFQIVRDLIARTARSVSETVYREFKETTQRTLEKCRQMIVSFYKDIRFFVRFVSREARQFSSWVSIIWKQGVIELGTFLASLDMPTVIAASVGALAAALSAIAAIRFVIPDFYDLWREIESRTYQASEAVTEIISKTAAEPEPERHPDWIQTSMESHLRILPGVPAPQPNIKEAVEEVIRKAAFKDLKPLPLTVQEIPIRIIPGVPAPQYRLADRIAEILRRLSIDNQWILFRLGPVITIDHPILPGPHLPTPEEIIRRRLQNIDLTRILEQMLL